MNLKELVLRKVIGQTACQALNNMAYYEDNRKVYPAYADLLGNKNFKILAAEILKRGLIVGLIGAASVGLIRFLFGTKME